EHDPDGALQYLRQLPHQAEKTAGLLIVLGGLAQTDPERALRLAREMATERGDWILYNAVFSRLAGEDVERAVKALELVPAGEPLANATRALTEKWMARAP